MATYDISVKFPEVLLFELRIYFAFVSRMIFGYQLYFNMYLIDQV